MQVLEYGNNLRCQSQITREVKKPTEYLNGITNDMERETYEVQHYNEIWTNPKLRSVFLHVVLQVFGHKHSCLTNLDLLVALNENQKQILCQSNAVCSFDNQHTSLNLLYMLCCVSRRLTYSPEVADFWFCSPGGPTPSSPVPD